MAYKHNITTRAKLLYQQQSITPAFFYFHKDDDDRICQLILVVEQIDYMTDVVEVLADKAVVSQAPAVNKVAIAAACYFPVKGLMYLMDYVHIFTRVEWWGSIVAISIMIRLFTLPFLINQLKATSKFSIRNMVENISSLKTSGAFGLRM